MIQPKACPLCGGGTWFHAYPGRHPYFIIGCNVCNLDMRGMYDDDRPWMFERIRDDFIEMWNRRVKE